MQRDVVPDSPSPVARNTVLQQECPTRIRAFDFEAVRTATEIGEPQVMERRRKKHQFAVRLHVLLLSEQFAEPITSHDMIEQHIAGHRTREFLGLTGDAAVRRVYFRNHIDTPDVDECGSALQVAQEA